VFSSIPPAAFDEVFNLTVAATSEAGESITEVTLRVKKDTGSTEIVDGNIKIFPIVVENELHVVGISADAIIVVKTIHGKELMRQNVDGDAVLHLDRFASGMYTVIVHTKDGRKTELIIKK